MKQYKAAIAGGSYGMQAKAVSLGRFDDFLDFLVNEDGRKAGPQELYKAVAYTFWCTRLRANNIGRIPYLVYPIEVEEDEADQDVEWPLDLRPTLWTAEAWLTLKGAGYALKHFEQQTLDELQILNANTMKVKTWDERGKALTFEQKVGTQHRIFQADEIVYWRLFDPKDDIREGTASGQVGQVPSTLVLNSNQWAAAFFENGAIPAVLLTTEGTVPPGEKDRINSAWSKMFKGVQKAFKTAVLERGLTPTVIGQHIKDLAMPDLALESRMQILAAHDLPAGLAEPKTNRAERDALQFELWDEHLIPYCEIFVEPVLNEQLFGPLGLRVSFQYQELEALQREEIAKAESMAFAIGGVMLPAYAENVVSVDEVRAWIDSVGTAAGLPPLEEDFEPEERTPPPMLAAANEDEGPETEIAQNIQNRTQPKSLLDDLGKWERKALSRIKEGYPLKALEFTSSTIPTEMHRMIVHSLEHAATIGDVIEVFKSARGEQKQIQFIPEGQGDPLPPIPSEVTITDADIDRAIKNWDRRMPEFAGLLDATVIRRENYDV